MKKFLLSTYCLLFMLTILTSTNTHATCFELNSSKSECIDKCVKSLESDANKIDNIRLLGIEMVHPENKVTNEYYCEHFKKQGKNIARLLEAYGRNERYITNENETTITMAVEAGKKVLESCNLKGEDIDLLIISTQTPEYLFPTNSLVVFKDLCIKKDAQFFDLNSNCLGMINATATANSIMKANANVKHALVIGSENASDITNPECEYLYPLFGDSACAIILERTNDKTVGILDTEFLSDGENALNYVLYPDKGFKGYYKDPTKRLTSIWKKFDASFIPEQAYKLQTKINARNNITFDDIDCFCYSQYAKGLTKGISEVFNANINKFIYVGDKYGYTGNNSPFMALCEGIKSGRIKRGDLISIWSIGTFWTSCGILMRY